MLNVSYVKRFVRPQFKSLGKGATFFKPWHIKLLESEKWATAQWLFIIPAARLGNQFLTVAQLGLSSFVFDFLGQIATNIFWLKIPISIDDWTARGLILFAMYVCVYKIFG